MSRYKWSGIVSIQRGLGLKGWEEQNGFVWLSRTGKRHGPRGPQRFLKAHDDGGAVECAHKSRRSPPQLRARSKLRGPFGRNKKDWSSRLRGKMGEGKQTRLSIRRRTRHFPFHKRSCVGSCTSRFLKLISSGGEAHDCWCRQCWQRKVLRGQGQPGQPEVPDQPRYSQTLPEEGKMGNFPGWLLSETNWSAY